MKIDTRIKKLADKYIHDVYNYSDAQGFEPFPETEIAYKNLRDAFIKNSDPYCNIEAKEDLLLDCADAYLEMGIYYGILYIVERIREIKNLL